MPKIAATPLLLGLNVAIFGLMLAGGVHPLSPTADSLIQWGANYGPKTTNGEWWRMCTAMFLHIGVLHLLFNMVAFWSVGGLMERLLGTEGFVVLYVLSGLLGSGASLAWNPFVVSAGASGAIFGLYGGLLGFLVLHRETSADAFLPALRTNTLAFLGFNLVYGFFQEGIDMAAHLGGLAGGFLCGLVLTHPFTLASRARRRASSTLLGLAGLVLLGGMTQLLQPVEDMEHVLQDFAAVDATSLAMFNSTLTQLQQGQLTEAGLVRVLEHDVLPPWRAQRAMLLRRQNLRQLPPRQQRLVSALVEYMTVRQEGWELLQEGLRQNDPQAIQRANDRQRHADHVLERFGVGGKQ